MNIKGSNIYIDKSQSILLLNSEAIYENSHYEWFIRFLKNKENPCVTKDEFENFSNEQKILLEGTLYDELYKNSSNEWEQYDYKEFYDKNERPYCSLCGEHNVQKAFYIQNKKNKKVFVVGSTCIDTYKDLHSRDGKSLKEIKKSSLIQSKKLNLNNKYPGIIDKIENWNKFIKDLPIYVSQKLEDEYNSVYIKLNNLYQMYLKTSNKRKTNELSEQIYTLVNNGDKLKKEMLMYIENNKKEKWNITPKIKKWCENNTATKPKKFLMEDGRVTFRSAYYIHEEELMQKIVNEFNNHFKLSKFRDISLAYNKKCVLLKSLRNNNIILEYDYTTLLDKYGEQLFNNESFYIDFNDLLNNSRIEDYNSLNYCSIQLGIYCNKTGISLLSDDTDLEKDTINFLLFDDNIVYTLSLKDMVNNFKELYYKNKISYLEKQQIKQYVLDGQNQSKEKYESNKSVYSDNSYKDNIYRKH